MEELIEHVSASAGIEPEVARKAIGMILTFLHLQGPATEVDKLMDALPGSREVASATATEEQGSAGGLMGLAGQLSGIGLGMSEMQTVGKELFAAARDRVGEDTMGAIAGSIPGLHQFV